MSERKLSRAAKSTEATVKDPVCGMTVDPAKARGKAQYKGDTYHFCSPQCMHRFVSEPAKFLPEDDRLPFPTNEAMPIQIAPTRPAQKDPVCGMTVDASKAAASIEHEGKLYHFCCKGCAEKFKADPSKYLWPAYRPGGMQPMVQLGGLQVQQAAKLERDPVCGMNVGAAKAAASVSHEGST